MNFLSSICWNFCVVNQFLCASYRRPSMPSGASSISSPLGFSMRWASLRNFCGFHKCSTTSEARIMSNVSGLNAKFSASPENTFEMRRLWAMGVIVGKSNPVTVWPCFAMGSLSTPSPHPTSRTFRFLPFLFIMLRKVCVLAWFRGLAYDVAVLCWNAAV